jgi:hypothetical protein
MHSENDRPSGRAERDVTIRRATRASPAHPHGSRIARSSAITAFARTGGLVLVDTRRGFQTALDEFGSRVWQLLADEPTLPALVEGLHDDHTRADRLAESVVLLLVRWRDGHMIAWQ